MTARAATVGLYVTVVTVVTAVLALVAAVVRLVVTLVSAARAFVEARTPVRPRRDAPTARDTTPRPASALRLVTAPPRSPTPAAPVAPTGAQRLDFALRGLGFAPRDVACAVGQLGPRVEHEPFEPLLKECLRVLAPAALAS